MVGDAPTMLTHAPVSALPSVMLNPAGSRAVARRPRVQVGH
jgi:hypothetical protein